MRFKITISQFYDLRNMRADGIHVGRMEHGDTLYADTYTKDAREFVREIIKEYS